MRPIPAHLRGYAATRWVLDGAAYHGRSVASISYTESGGQVSTQPLNSPGGGFTLSGDQAASRAGIFPGTSFGNSLGSAAAWSLEVEGLACQGARSTFQMGFFSEPYPDEGTWIYWGASGVKLITSTVTAAETLKMGDFSNVANGSLGVLVDASKVADVGTSATGWFGGVEAKIPSDVFAAGTLNAVVRHTGAGSVTARRVVLTVYWGRPGDVLTKAV